MQLGWIGIWMPFLLAGSPVAFVACGGSAEGGSASGVTANIDKACQQRAGLACGETLEGCKSQLESERSEAVARGCASEVDAALRCGAEHPSTCVGAGTSDPEVAFSEACADEIAANEDCLGSCSGEGGEDTCSMSCTSAKLGTISASCQGSGSSFTCTCTGGPHDTSTYTITSCELTSFDETFYSNCF